MKDKYPGYPLEKIVNGNSDLEPYFKSFNKHNSVSGLTISSIERIARIYTDITRVPVDTTCGGCVRDMFSSMNEILANKGYFEDKPEPVESPVKHNNKRKNK